MQFFFMFHKTFVTEVAPITILFCSQMFCYKGSHSLHLSFSKIYVYLLYKIYYFFLFDNFSVGVTILLSLTVFLLLVAETMPPTSDAVPLIGETAHIMRCCPIKSISETPMRTDVIILILASFFYSVDKY